MPVLSSYRNQSFDLLRKSTDQFPYEGNTGTQWVNGKLRQLKVHKKAPQQIFNKIINTPLLVEQIRTYFEKVFEDFEYVFDTLVAMLEYSAADKVF